MTAKLKNDARAQARYPVNPAVTSFLYAVQTISAAVRDPYV